MKSFKELKKVLKIWTKLKTVFEKAKNCHKV